MKWTTTEERALEVAVTCDPPSEEESQRSLDEHFPLAAVIWVPSPFALSRIGKLPDGNTLPHAGHHEPKSLTDFCRLIGADVPDDATDSWDTQTYTPENMSYKSHSFFYYHVFLAVAIDGGYVPPEPLPPMIAASAFITHSGAVVCARLPVTRSLHGPFNAMSFTFSDGRSITRINGTTANTDVVVRPHTLSAMAVLKTTETNADLRSYAIDCFAGPDTEPSQGRMRFLREIDATVLDRHTNDIATPATYEAVLDCPAGRFLVATCPTKRIVVLSVPTDVTTCEQAARWLCVDHNGEPLHLIART